MLNTGNVIDISIKSDQRISAVLKILSERGYIKYDSKSENVFIRSWRFGDFFDEYKKNLARKEEDLESKYRALRLKEQDIEEDYTKAIKEEEE